MVLSQDLDGDMPHVNWQADSPSTKSVQPSRLVAQGVACFQGDGNSLPPFSHDPLATNPDPKHDQDILRSVIQAVQRTSSFSIGACSAPTSNPPLHPHPLPSRPPSSHNQQTNLSAHPPPLSQELISSRAIDVQTLSTRSSDPQAASNVNSGGVWGTQESKKDSGLMHVEGYKENCIKVVKPNQTPMTTGRKKKRQLTNDSCVALGPPSASRQVSAPCTDIGQTMVEKNVVVEDERVREGLELNDLLQRVAQAADLHSNDCEHEQSQALPPPVAPPALALPHAVAAPVEFNGIGSSWDAAGAAFDSFFDDIDDQSLDLALANAKPQDAPPVIPLAFGREESLYSVKSVEPGDRLVLYSEFLKSDVIVQLKDGWADTEIAPGDKVNIIGSQRDPLSGSITLDSSQGMLILNPDNLVSGTSVMAAMRCVRQAYLQDQLSGDSSRAAVLGQLSHELLQTSVLGPLSSKGVNGPRLTREITRIVARNKEKLAEVDLKESEAEEQLQRHVHSFVSFHSSYLSSSSGGPLDMSHRRSSDPSTCKINEVVDIEENIWAPRYGLKGQIDATLRVEINSRSHGPSSHLVPFEFKSGKDYALGHRGQLILYLLLVQERYGESVDIGLLWNVGWGGQGMKAVQGAKQEISGLISHRNRLVAAQSRPIPPPMLSRSYACNNCPMAETCALSHKIEGGGEETQGWEDKARFISLTSHLSQEHCAYIYRFMQLVGMEEAHCAKGTRHQMWSMRGEERAKLHPNLCLPNLMLSSTSQASGHDGEGEPVHRYVFVCADRSLVESCPFSKGEHLVLSVDRRHPVLARVNLESLNRQTGEVVVSSSRDVKVSKLQSISSSPLPLVWRLDKDESSAIFNSMRSNLLQLAKPDAIATNLRKTLIDLLPPPMALTSSGPSCARMDLNPEQCEALHRSLSLPVGSFLLIQGFPGSGKTSTLVSILKALIAMGKKVLLTSYTNSALDNVLRKLLSSSDGQTTALLRIGHDQGVHESIKPYLPSGLKCSLGPSSLPTLVAATCLSVRHPLLSGQTFDVCICDEASQVTTPSLLGPLLLSQSFILIGDHYQLQPLVSDAGALKGGLGENLLSTLATAHPSCLIKLNQQYRMSESIMRLSNELVYSGEMRCGSKAVASGKLEIHDPSQLVDLPSWILAALDPDRRVVFIDTSLNALNSKGEEVVPHGIVNVGEVKALSEVLKALLDVGIKPGEIGITSPYKAQVDLMSREAGEIEVMTLDRFQGKEKDVILLSLVRENVEGETGKLLADWRRINVAITRASKKLILIGHSKTLKNLPMLSSLMDLVAKEQGIVIMKMV